MAKKEEVKGLYVFRHPNKYLTVSVLGVQFIDGKFETEDRKLAEKLVEYDDMEIVSQP